MAKKKATKKNAAKKKATKKKAAKKKATKKKATKKKATKKKATKKKATKPGVPASGRRLVTVEVHDLHGLFSYRLPLVDGPITLIHGENGMGKTGILLLVSLALNQRFLALSQVEFRALVLGFSDDHALTFFRSPGEERPVINVSLTLGSKTLYETDSSGLAYHYGPRILRLLSIHTPLRRVGPHEWVDDDGALLDTEEAVERYEYVLPRRALGARSEETWWLHDFLSPDRVHLIETQRLLRLRASGNPGRHADIQARTSVEWCASDLSERIEECHAESSRIAFGFDRTLPKRLLESNPSKRVAEESEIRARYLGQSKFRNRLVEAGLLSATEHEVFLPGRELQAFELSVLDQCLSDAQKKLDVYKDLVERVEFLKSVCERFKRKTLLVSREHGMQFLADTGADIPLDGLSSGEQHLVVMTFNLLFRAQADSLILIDEPEISLHVTWQHRVIPDLEKLASLSRLHIIVATHSPQVVHGRFDLTRALDEFVVEDQGGD